MDSNNYMPLEAIEPTYELIEDMKPYLDSIFQRDICKMAPFNFNLLLEHSAHCKTETCHIDCRTMKTSIAHRNECKIIQQCRCCLNLNRAFMYHAKYCWRTECFVPQCMELRTRMGTVNTEFDFKLKYICSNCKEIAMTYCKSCPNKYYCATCAKHGHPMTHSSKIKKILEKRKKERMNLVEQLNHQAKCGLNCSSSCAHWSEMIKEFEKCDDKFKCRMCRNVLEIIYYHTRKCCSPNCNVPCCALVVCTSEIF